MASLLAALDLGSNSFRLSTGRVVHCAGKPRIQVLTRLKETVQLAAGLDQSGILDRAAIQRGVHVLSMFAEHLAQRPVTCVRVVATNTLRLTQNLDEVLPEFHTALGYPIEIISGDEEARLIFVGVNHELPAGDQHRLMVDIGGGSTEVILGKGDQPLHLTSLPMGCVSYTQRFFDSGLITAERMDQAVSAAHQEIAPIVPLYQQAGWQQVYGSSGTAKGLLAVLQQGGMSDQGITHQGLLALRRKLVADGEVRIRQLPGLKPDRARVLAGGLAIMLALFEALKIDQPMLAGEGALRMGVMTEMAGLNTHDGLCNAQTK